MTIKGGEKMNKKLEEFHQQLKGNLQEVKKKIEGIEQLAEMRLLSYFTYSLNISHDIHQENLCLGSYHIRNIGNQTITNPYICIKMPKDAPFTFTGKYIYQHMKQKGKNPGSWERMNEQEDPEQFWLKSIEQQSIKPNETLSFSDFQLKWTPTESYAGSIMGFTYSEENREGIAAINAINLSETGITGGTYNE